MTVQIILTITTVIGFRVGEANSTVSMDFILESWSFDCMLCGLRIRLLPQHKLEGVRTRILVRFESSKCAATKMKVAVSCKLYNKD